MSSCQINKMMTVYGIKINALLNPTDTSVVFSFLFVGNYQKALDTYKDIHRKFPENAECK